MSWLIPIKLKGTHATLEPLAREHAPALVEAASDGELWKLWVGSPGTELEFAL